MPMSTPTTSDDLAFGPLRSTTKVARALLPLGTTTVVADPHEIANVWGTAGLDYLLSASEGLPVDFFFMLPSCVPASPLETSGARLEAEDLERYRRHPRILGLAEVMNFPGLVAGDQGLLAKLALFPQGPVDGHAPLLSGRALNAYRLAGIGSDHECTCLAEAREKLRLGFYLMLREGSLAKNLADLLPAVTPASLRRTMLVTDDSHPEDLARTGHLNHLLRQAVSLGLDPLAAVTMATLNPAEYFRLRDRGAVGSGTGGRPGSGGGPHGISHRQGFEKRQTAGGSRQAAGGTGCLPRVGPEPLPCDVKDLDPGGVLAPGGRKCGQGYRPDSRPVAHRKAPLYPRPSGMAGWRRPPPRTF